MKQVKIRTDPNIAESFKRACLASGVSMSSELTRYMAERADSLSHLTDKTSDTISVRSGRRKEVTLIISRLEQILDAEETYQSRIPENLQSGPAYEISANSIDALEQAIDMLREVY